MIFHVMKQEYMLQLFYYLQCIGTIYNQNNTHNKVAHSYGFIWIYLK